MLYSKKYKITPILYFCLCFISFTSFTRCGLVNKGIDILYPPKLFVIDTVNYHFKKRSQEDKVYSKIYYSSKTVSRNRPIYVFTYFSFDEKKDFLESIKLNIRYGNGYLMDITDYIGTKKDTQKKEDYLLVALQKKSIGGFYFGTQTPLKFVNYYNTKIRDYRCNLSQASCFRVLETSMLKPGKATLEISYIWKTKSMTVMKKNIIIE